MSNKDEKFFLTNSINTIKSVRKEIKIVQLDEEGSEDFWKILGGKPDTLQTAKEGGDDELISKKKFLYKFNPDSKDKFDMIEDGPSLNKKHLQEDR
jgi:hypothetical protein